LKEPSVPGLFVFIVAFAATAQVPEIFAPGVISGAFTDVDPAVAPDESFLVFGSGRAPARSMDLFIVYRSNGQWGEPKHLGDEVNSAGSDAEPRLSPDARTLYFSSERVMPVVFPRSVASAQTDLLRIQAWDNGLYNIWMIPLERWLPGETPRVH
jgi:hypothetical protein